MDRLRFIGDSFGLSFFLEFGVVAMAEALRRNSTAVFEGLRPQYHTRPSSESTLKVILVSPSAPRARNISNTFLGEKRAIKSAFSA
jgi:hypothetical protein